MGSDNVGKESPTQTTSRLGGSFAVTLLLFVIFAIGIDTVLVTCIIMSWSLDWYSVNFAQGPSWVVILAVFSHACIFMDIMTSRMTGKHTGLWTCLRGCGLKVNGETYVLVLAMLLPAHVLCLYGELGEPVWSQPLLGGYNVDMLVNDTFWPSYGNLSVDEISWVVTVHNNTNISAFALSTRECYEPASGEFKILERLVGDRPKQAECETTLGSLAVEALGWDDDGWEETFDFSLRIFAALAGVIANKVLEGDSGGFMEDLSDIFDMYMFTFADTEQIHEGKKLMREGSTGKMHEWIWACVVLGYASMLVRCYMSLAYDSNADPIAWLSRTCVCGGKCEKERLRNVFDAFLSLMFIELPFLALRIYAAGMFRIPVSIMGVKNAFSAISDIRSIFRCGAQEKQASLDDIDVIDTQKEEAEQDKIEDDLEATGKADILRTPCEYGANCRNFGRGHRKRFFHEPSSFAGSPVVLPCKVGAAQPAGAPSPAPASQL
mmetsp:Transcript_137465/g.293775  ORF Transcript_137465/g.293775 Transcript_137465/m.293775 type:complete len:492 (+) Transcript_137465:74-1549(+)